jgi:hypothetical protein
MIRHSALRAAAFLVACPLLVNCYATDALGQVFYQWILADAALENGSNVPGPVEGTIGFSTLIPGGGGSHLPSSFTIDSAPGHNINNGYTLGDEIVGSSLWEDISQDPSFEFDVFNVATSGDFAFREPIIGVLLMDFRTPSESTFFRSPSSPNLITKGTATWTILVPEPGAYLLLVGGCAVGIAVSSARGQQRLR